MPGLVVFGYSISLIFELMITRIEIDGFKSFKDFSVDLAPLTVIAGPNASGKSNLFDALRLLSGLARGESFPFGLHGRGLPDDLFTKYDEHQSSTKMAFAVEMFLPRMLTNGRLPQSVVSHPRLRYEVVIGQDVDRINEVGYTWYPIIREKLFSIKSSDDEWVKKYLSDTSLDSYGLPQNKELTFTNSHSGKFVAEDKEGNSTVFGNLRALIPTAAISEANQNGNPVLIAVREELQNLRLLDLNDRNNFTNYGLRTPITDPDQTLNILVRLKKKSPEIFQFLSTQLNQIVSGLGKIDLYTDELNRSTVTVTDRQGRRFPFESLSEGTLRIIALAARLVENDMRHVLLLEEPENGIDPLRLENLVQLLVGLSANFDASGDDLRQLICTTHSPVLLKALLKNEHALVVFCSQPTYLFNDEKRIRRSVSITRMTPLQLDARTNVNAGRIEKITLLQALNYFKELTIDVSEFESSVHA